MGNATSCSKFEKTVRERAEAVRDTDQILKGVTFMGGSEGLSLRSFCLLNPSSSAQSWRARGAAPKEGGLCAGEVTLTTGCHTHSASSWVYAEHINNVWTTRHLRQGYKLSLNLYSHRNQDAGSVTLCSCHVCTHNRQETRR